MPETPVDAAVLREAADWFAVLQDHPVSETDLARWRGWLDAHPHHRAAWQRVEGMSRQFQQLPAATDRAAAVRALHAVRGRRRALKMLAVSAGTGLGAWALADLPPWPAWTADARTDTGETRAMDLADGSRVWLNAGTAADVDVASALRRVVLHAGEVLVEPSGDRRPFVVDTPQGRVHATGTRCSVRLDGATCDATVFSGDVDVAPVDGRTRRVAAGQRLRFDRHGNADLWPASAGRETWTRGVLLAENMPLGEFVAELSGHHRGLMTCADAVAGLRLVGAFPLNDLDAVLAAVERSLPVAVRRPVPGWVRIEAR